MTFKIKPVSYTALLLMSLVNLLHGFAGAFVVGQNDPKFALLFLYVSWFAWFPLCVLALFTRRLAAFLMAVCVVAGLTIEHFNRYPSHTPRTERIWLVDSLGPLAASAIVLLILDKIERDKPMTNLG